MISEYLLPGIGAGLHVVDLGDLHDDRGLRCEVGPDFLHPRHILPEDLIVRVDGHRPLDLEAALLSPPGEGHHRVLRHVLQGLLEVLVRYEQGFTVEEPECPDRDDVRHAVLRRRGQEHGFCPGQRLPDLRCQCDHCYLVRIRIRRQGY